jgi:hypothetical protein
MFICHYDTDTLHTSHYRNSDMCNYTQEFLFIYSHHNGFGSLEVACWPLVPKFTGSNPAEAVRFLRAKKSSACLPSEGK